MATVQVTIPDALVTRLTAAAHGTFPQYAALTPTALFKQVTSDYWRKVLADYEVYVAADAGQTAAATLRQAALDKAAADAAGIA